MSKYTAEQIEMRARAMDCLDMETADMLREYAATPSQQAEWPSDADVEHACKAAAMEADGAIFPDAYSNEEADDVRNYMRAALQSVRPPASADAGAVSNEDVRIGVRAYNENVVGLQQRVRQVLESYASRHARQVPGELLSALRAAVDNPCDDAYWILQAKTALAKWEKVPPAPEKD